MSRLNYFAEGEQAGQERFRSLRDRLLAPVVRMLIACRATPDLLSLLSLSLLIPAGWLMIRDNSPASVLMAAGCVILHVVIDAFDGPLARATGRDGQAGALTDMCVDHTGLLVTASLLPAAGLADGAWCAAYVSSYTLAIVFTIWLNMAGRPFRFVIRTKYILYALLTWYGLTGLNWLNPALSVFCGIHSVFGVAGFLKVRAILRETDRTRTGG